MTTQAIAVATHAPLTREFIDSLERAWRTTHDFLRAEMNAAGHWTGELSASALSTATAISALAQVVKAGCITDIQKAEIEDAIATGCRWLSEHQNADGGFGDTNRSHSNIATSLLVLAAWELAAQVVAQQTSGSHSAASSFWDEIARQKKLAWQFADRQGRWDGLRRRYGRDKTFVVPILSNCALAGLVSWEEVAALPFEAAWLPQDMYRWARMPVVSYAIPALVAIGQARFHFSPPKNPMLRMLRSRALQPTLGVLRKMQPASGGYLEATPLTSFVLMNLAAVGHGKLPVAQDCLRFILDSRLPDGSWPIDTNLATWLTSLSVHALSRRGSIELGLADTLVSPKTVRWLLSCQHLQRHPFTGANPGGWGWTDLSGAVPDADDTPAALLALSNIDWSTEQWWRLEQQALSAVGLGLRWLLRLQNRDGGWPTFCRGWGKLPFDRSGTDLTAHALRACHAWLPELERIGSVAGSATPTVAQIRTAMRRGLAYLAANQRDDGSWLPLWFGNQDRPEEDNPVYGTGKVLLAYGELGLSDRSPARRGIEYLTQHQNADGGWGGGASVHYQGLAPGSTSTIEETAIALEGLLWCGQTPAHATIIHALNWLALSIQSGNLSRSFPIGFYFAKLWYHERLYPALFSLGALGTALSSINQMTSAPIAAEPNH